MRPAIQIVIDPVAVFDEHPQNALGFYERGRYHLQCGKLESALSDLDKAIRCDPQLAGAWNARGAVQIQMGKSDAALSDFEEAIRLDPLFAKAHLNRGYLLEAKGSEADAIAAYERAISLDPKFVPAYTNLGGIRLKQHDYDTAIRAYGEAIELDPCNSEYYLQRALCFQKIGDYSHAALDCSKCLELSTELTDAFRLRAYSLHCLRRYAEAIQDYSEVIRRQPDDVYAHTWVGWCHFRRDDLSAASANVSEALRLAPNELAARHLNVRLLDVSGRYSEAVDEYSAVIAGSPDWAEVFYDRGACMLKLGWHQEALFDVNEAIRLGRETVSSYDLRGAIWLALGDSSKAAADQEKAAALKKAKRLNARKRAGGLARQLLHLLWPRQL